MTCPEGEMQLVKMLEQIREIDLKHRGDDASTSSEAMDIHPGISETGLALAWFDSVLLIAQLELFQFRIDSCAIQI